MCENKPLRLVDLCVHYLLTRAYLYRLRNTPSLEGMGMYGFNRMYLYIIWAVLNNSLNVQRF